MGVTAFSFLLLPLCLVWSMSPDRLLKLIAVAAVFEAAAALTIGSFGVQPGLIPALAFMAFVALQLLLGVQYPGQAPVWRMTRPFVLVALWAVSSSYLMPRLFEGRVFVWPQKATPPFVLTLLAPSPTNMNQDIYLVIDCILLCLTAMYLTRSRLRLRAFLNAYFLSGFVVGGVAVWQFASKVAGVPFPDDLFFSNPGWAILTDQSIGAVPRINGPFSEPSALASYMASIVCSSGWLLLKGNRDTMVRWLFAIGLMTMGLSTSTTGFAVLAVVGTGVPLYALLSGSTRMLASILKIGIPLLLLALVGVTAIILLPSFNNNVAEVLSATLNKQQSSSYEDRTSADVDSLTAMMDTYGLGVGWGSNRSSSLIPGLLAGVGLPGFAGLLWFGFGVTRQVRAARAAGCSREQSTVMDGCCGGLVGFLLAAVLSAPTINSVTFFFMLGLLIATAARAQLDAPAARRGPARIDAGRIATAAPSPVAAAGAWPLARGVD